MKVDIDFSIEIFDKERNVFLSSEQLEWKLNEIKDKYINERNKIYQNFRDNDDREGFDKFKAFQKPINDSLWKLFGFINNWKL